MTKKIWLFTMIGLLVCGSLGFGRIQNLAPRTIVNPIATDSRADIELAYDDGIVDSLRGLPINYKIAVRFSPNFPSACTLKTARFYLQSATGVDTFTVIVYDSSSSGPGNLLIGPLNAVPSTGTGWLDVDLSIYNLALDHDFYIAIIWYKNSVPKIGLDTSTTIDLRTWYSNGGAYSQLTWADAMIRAVVNADVGFGPDQWGYTGIDNKLGGGPPFNFVDITTIGTRITELQNVDDGFSGWYNIGFDFPYYNYTNATVPTSKFYVGSNGFMGLAPFYVSARANLAATFPPIPTATPPNSFLAPVAYDAIVPASPDSGGVYYYTNNSDSLIVMWDRIDTWDATVPAIQHHTFEVIITKGDSCIYFFYGPQDGTFTGDPSEMVSVGIENPTGTMGLQYYYGEDAIDTLYDGLAVKFIPPPESVPSFSNLAVMAVANDLSQAGFYQRFQPTTFWTKIVNDGNVAINQTMVVCTVKKGATTKFADTLYVGPINPGQIDSIGFETWANPDTGDYSVTVKQVVVPPAVDQNNNDNQLVAEAWVIEPPCDLKYDNGTPASWQGWQGDSAGYGNEFVPPAYPCTLSAVKMNLSFTGSQQFRLWILDDDGPNNTPGTILYDATKIATLNQAWQTYTLPAPIIINDGAFFIGEMQIDVSTPSMGIDASTPLSRRGWEFTGTWAPGRDRESNDVCVRAVVNFPTGIWEGEANNAALPNVIALDQNRPNPLTNNTKISFVMTASSTIKVKVYNITGQLVKTLLDEQVEAGEHTITWNGLDEKGNGVANGIYFYQLQTDNQNLTRKMIITR